MKKFLIIIVSLMAVFSCNNHHAVEEQANMPVLLSDTNNKASCVYLITDEKNSPVVSWCETDSAGTKYFFMAYFDSVSQKFDKAIPVPIEQNAGIHEEGMPKIAIKKDGIIIAVYETTVPTKENQWAGFIHYVQSSDKGKTWTQPLCVHEDTTSGKEHSFASLARLADGEIGACWLDESFNPKQGGRSVKFAKTVGSKGFQHEILIDSSACECCRTAISSDDKGNVSILFRSLLPGSVRDISCCTSKDDGKTFNAAISFSNDKWVVNGCPHNGPCIVTTGQYIYTTWFTGGNGDGVYYARLDENRNVINKIHINAKGRFTQLCVLPESRTAIVAYNENDIRNDSLFSPVILDKIDGENVTSKTITPKGMQASYPVTEPIAANRVLVAWRSNDKIYYRFVNTDSINDAASPSQQQVAVPKPDFSSVKFALPKDLSCGMPLTMGISDTVHYKGKIYGFCSDECRSRFLKNPESYLVKK